MRIGTRTLCFLLLVMTALSTACSVAKAQPAATVHKQPHAELALSYDYLRSNAPPGGCTCFSLNGGNATLALPIKSSNFAIAGDISVTHASSITSSGYSLTLSTYTAGIRYRPSFRGGSLQPFGQILAGIAHSSGTLVEGQGSVASNSGASFAAYAGGGLDLRLSRRFSLRLVEANYLATTVNNGVNDHQNNLRVNTGLVFHF